MGVRREEVERVLESEVRPLVAAHGGQLRLVDYSEDGTVTVNLLGACAGCPSADLSTRQYIEDTLKSRLPQVSHVELYHPTDPELLDLARKLLGHNGG